MPKAEKPALLNWLFRRRDEGVFSLRKTLERGARLVLGKSAIAAEAYAEANLNAFWNYVLAAQDQLERRGISPIWHVVDGNARTLRWYATPSAHNSTQSRKLAKLRHRADILRMIDMLTSREYEALACVLMELVGASKIALTPSGNEGGIDFFALLCSPTKCHLFAGGYNPLRIVGQSKKYSHSVQAGTLKEFLKTIDEVKHRSEPKTERVIPPWFRSTNGPIVGCMIAHNGFQSGAASRARNHGVITADSLDVAEAISLSRGLPENLPADRRAKECLFKVRSLLT